MATYVLKEGGGVRLKNDTGNTPSAPAQSAGSIVVREIVGPASELWTWPAGVSRVLVECYGGGGGGRDGNDTSSGAGSGGGGGGYISATVGAAYIALGSQVLITAGGGGVVSDDQNGGTSSFGYALGNKITAIGGESPGDGGAFQNPTLPGVVYTNDGQGDGGSTPTTTTGADGGAAGGPRGGAGGAGGAPGKDGAPGGRWGGGGGGGGGDGPGNTIGGKGAPGVVILRYLAPNPG